MSQIDATADEVLERITDGFYAVDEEWRFTYLNERAESMLGVDREDVVGEVIWEEFEAATDTVFQEKYEQAMETQEEVSFEAYYAPLSIWTKIHVYPSESGLSVYFEDVTERVERERELERYETIVETVEDGIYVIDEDDTFSMVNEAYAEMVGYDREELLGADVSLVADDETVAAAESIETKLKTGQRSKASLEATIQHRDGSEVPAEATFALLPDGERVGVVRDISARRERAEQLTQIRELLEQTERIADVGGWEIDVETTDVFWTSHLVDLLGVEYDETPSLEQALEVYHEADRATVETAVEKAIASAEPFDVEARFVTPDGAVRWHRVQGVPKTEDGEVTKLRGTAQDITDRKEREQQLELYERVVDTVEDGVYAVDEDDEFVMVNDAFCAMTGYERTELLGSPSTLIKDEAVKRQAERLVQELEGGREIEAALEFDLHTADGDTIPVESRFDSIHLDGSIGRCSVVRDITEQKQFERRLVDLHGTARDLFRASDEEEIVEIATHALQEILDAPAAGYYQYDPGEHRLSPAGVSDSGGIVDIDLPDVEPGEGSLVGSVFDAERPRRVDDLRAVPEYDDAIDGFDLQSVVMAPVGKHGVLITGSQSRGAFDDGMQQLVEIVATNVAAAFDRVDHEQQLRERRDRLAALSDIESLVHSLSESMFGLSSKDEIEQLVCDRLASSDSFEFAWIGEAGDGEVRCIHEAGVEDYLADLTLALDGPLAELGPTAQAHRTGEMHVIQDIDTDPRYEPWRAHARSHGYRASASVPIVDSDDLRGTLNVYSSRRDAFGEEEREALRRLGSIIAYALSSVERDRTLQRERNRLEFMNRLLRHNLLNSLNVVKARLDLLDGRVDYEVYDDLQTATERTAEMIEFVQTVREVTKVIGRGGEQKLRPRAIGDVLETRVKRAQDGFPDAEYHLESSPAVTVVADDLLGEVFDNVLLNAVQHNPSPDPKIWVDASVYDDRVDVTIADDGPGIPDDQTETIFDRESQSFDDPGSGFGLYLVNEIVSSYGGDVTVEDSDQDGARFRLTFRRTEQETLR